MSDVIRQIEAWLETEPNQTEVIILRKEDDGFEVTLQYGNRTTVPQTSDDLTTALTKAVGKASRLASSARRDAEKKTKVIQKKPTVLPGVESIKLPGM